MSKNPTVGRINEKFRFCMKKEKKRMDHFGQKGSRNIKEFPNAAAFRLHKEVIYHQQTKRKQQKKDGVAVDDRLSSQLY